MPMMMDEDVESTKFDDMDDLFLDTQPTLMPAQVYTKDMILRLDELSTQSCCRKLAWSKAGSIARISGDLVTVQTYARDKGMEDFAFSKPVVLQLPLFMLTPINLQWSETGHDLAVVDIAGRVAIFQQVFGQLNRMHLVGRFMSSEQENDWNVVRGLIWLSALRPMSRLSTHARKPVDRWTYPMSASTQNGPFHPIPTKAGLLLVTHSGCLRLLFGSLQPSDNAYDETNIMLEPLEQDPCSITHASFTAEQSGTCLLATLNEAHVIKIYRIMINWNYPFREKEIPPRTFRLQPTLEVSRLKQEKLWKYANLFQFHLLPAVADDVTGSQVPDTLMAASHEMDMQTGQQCTRIMRWELRHGPEELHGSFAQLATKNVSAASMLKAGYGLMDLTDIVIPGIVLEWNMMRNNSILALARNDGAVSFIDRLTMQPIIRDSTSNMLRSLMDAGFCYSPGPVCAHVSFSPSGYAFATGDNDDNFVTRYVDFPMEQQDSSELLANDDLTSVALCLAFAATPLGQQQSYQQQSYDDLLGLLQQNSGRINVQALMESSLSSVGINLNATAQDSGQRLFNSAGLPRCLSMQHLMGSFEDQSPLTSKMAWILLNLRHTAWAFHISMTTLQNSTIADLADLPASLLGLVEWVLALKCTLIRGLFWSSRRLKGRDDANQLLEELMTSPTDPALALLLTNISRIFFRFNTRSIRSIATFGTTRLSSSTSTNGGYQTHAQSWHALNDLIAACPFTPIKFETLLAELDHHVKKTYDDAGWDDTTRAQAECEMLVTGRVPRVLAPVVHRLLTSALDKVFEGNGAGGNGAGGNRSGSRLQRLLSAGMSGTAPGGMNIWEPATTTTTTPMTTTGSGPAASAAMGTLRRKGGAGAGNAAPALDVIRKVPLLRLKEFKRCVVCGSVMENLPLHLARPLPPGAGGGGAKLTMWIVQLQKTCVCGGAWALEGAEEASSVG